MGGSYLLHPSAFLAYLSAAEGGLSRCCGILAIGRLAHGWRDGERALWRLDGVQL